MSRSALTTDVPFKDVITAYRNGSGWEDIAREHALDVAAFARDVQWSQDVIERRSEDRSPRGDSPPPTAAPGRGAAPPTPPAHGHGH